MFNGKKIGLALSGGGALGAAHIGIIEEIEKAGVKPDCVCGVSSGAIIGLIYAAGGTKALHDFFDELAGSKIFQKKEYLLIGGPRRIRELVESLLEKRIAGRSFADLEMNFAGVATNIATGRKEMISQGDPVAAVMASSAYPALSPIKKIGRDYYFDGGVTCNLPAEDARRMGADFVIGSSIYSISEIDRKEVAKMGKLAILWRTFDIFDKQLNRYEARSCDFLFKPKIDSFKIFDFTRLREIEKMGRGHAKRNIKTLVNLLENEK